MKYYTVASLIRALVMCAAIQQTAEGLQQGTFVLRVFGEVEDIYLASTFTVKSVTTLTSVAVELGADSSIQRVIVCPSNEDGAPNLSNPTYVSSALSTGAVSATKVCAPEAPPTLDPGQWWIVLHINPADMAGRSESEIGFVPRSEACTVLLGDGSEDWATVEGIQPGIQAELAESLVGKSAAGSSDRARRQRDEEGPVTAFRGVAPNPLRGGTYFAFLLASSGPVQVSIFDTRGRLIRHLGPFEYGEGEGHLAWDGKSENGQLVATGVYHARLQGPGLRHVSQVVVLR